MSSLGSEVLQSAHFISDEAKSVKINMRGVQALAEKLVPQFLDPSDQADKEATPTLEPPQLSPTELLEWCFLLDVLNFCFWSNEPVLFTISYRDVQWTGYRSLCAALAKAVEDGIPIYRPSYYGKVSEEKLREIFRSETHVELPLIGQRRDNLWEAARVLDKEFDGKVSELIRRSEKSAQKLISLLVQHFPSFRDVGVYRGRKVMFLKRAQIFAADVWHRFGGEGYGEFHDIDTLTMFADYRVPQSLLYLHVLEYSDELMARLRTRELLEAGGEAEAEIRGCSIWAVELIRQRMCKLIQALPSSPDSPMKKGGVVNSVTLDYYLWNYAKTHTSDMQQFPIHRTHTNFY